MHTSLALNYVVGMYIKHENRSIVELLKCPGSIKFSIGICSRYFPNEAKLYCLLVLSDIDECREAALDRRTLCLQPQLCENTPGSYQCQCPPGTEMINNTCRGTACCNFYKEKHIVVRVPY